MTRVASIGSILGIAVLTAVAQQPQTSVPSFKELTERLAALTAEVRTLRLELLEQRLAQQDQNISWLQDRRQKLQTDRRALDEREQSTLRELNELNQRLSQPGLDPAERTQLEALRTTAVTSGIADIAAERSFIAQEEAKIDEQLQREERRRRALLDTAERLRATPGPS